LYGTDGISPTITTGKKVFISSLKFGQIQKVLGGLQKNASQTNGDISPTLTSAMGMGGGHIPVIIPEDCGIGEEPIVHNLQPRNPNRPSLTRLCDCGSGKLYQKCHGTPAGSGHIYKTNGVTYCLDTGNTQGVQIGHKIRRLTEVECERLQGFPDNWTEGISSTQRYKCLGNAVTVNVVYEVAKNL
jgi:site-specific DNA-cytosine methylase